MSDEIEDIRLCIEDAQRGGFLETISDVRADRETLMREVDLLRARVAELEAAQEWRPIESAPRDGTSIIAYRPSDPPAIEAMYWVNYEDCGGDWHWSYDSDVPASSPPTHWLPLPAPPKVAT